MMDWSPDNGLFLEHLTASQDGVLQECLDKREVSDVEESNDNIAESLPENGDQPEIMDIEQPASPPSQIPNIPPSQDHGRFLHRIDRSILPQLDSGDVILPSLPEDSESELDIPAKDENLPEDVPATVTAMATSQHDEVVVNDSQVAGPARQVDGQIEQPWLILEEVTEPKDMPFVCPPTLTLEAWRKYLCDLAILLSEPPTEMDDEVLDMATAELHRSILEFNLMHFNPIEVDTHMATQSQMPAQDRVDCLLDLHAKYCRGCLPPDQHGGGEASDTNVTEDGNAAEPVLAPPKLFRIILESKTQSKKLATQVQNMVIRVNPPDNQADFRESLRLLRATFDEVLERFTANLQPHHQARLTIRHPTLDNEIWIPFYRVDELTADIIMAAVERILQSHEEFTFDHNLSITFVHTALPFGGNEPRPVKDLADFKKDLKCILSITNKDNLCLGRAIVVGKAIADGMDKTDRKRWDKVRRNTKVQKAEAQAMFRLANVQPGICGQAEFPIFQRALPDYQLVVTSYDAMNAIVYRGPEAVKKIMIFHNDEHFDVIRSMHAFYNRSAYCFRCAKAYNNENDHKCNFKCQSCSRVTCPRGEWTACTECNRCFPSQECYDWHKKVTAVTATGKNPGKKSKTGGTSICERKYKCLKCKRVVDKSIREDEHRCGERLCFICRKFVPADHQCYIQKAKPTTKRRSTRRKKKAGAADAVMNEGVQQEEEEEEEEGQVYITFDYETMLDADTSEHIPNAVVAHRTCPKCFGVEQKDFCAKCHTVEFSGNDCSTEFCKWVLAQEGSIVICHNFKGYDSYFLMQYLHDRAVLPDIIMNGMKILTMTVNSVKFIDSLNFLPMALRQLPATFGLQDKVRKGFFPHLLSTTANQDYNGQFPEAKHYDPDSMTPKQRTEFYEWYDGQKNQLFNLLEELYAYCRSDVEVLRRCCARFQGLFLDICDLDPFQSCITIASTCNLVYRTKFLEPETIAVIPPLGYRPKANYSQKAIAWLKWVAERDGIEIQHAENMGERQIGPYKADGFYGNTALEFLGCYWHSCDICYKDKSVRNQVTGTTMGDLHEAWRRKEQYYKAQGYRVISIWECQYEQMLKNNAQMREFVKQLNHVTPLEPRDAFYGGRTNAACLYAEPAAEEESIRYVDVCSLYPWVNKYCHYPVGHPKILTENLHKDISQYEGIIKCKVAPPRKLFHPVLPYRTNNKLLFPLCGTCADTMAQTTCEHTDEDRAIVGTWVTVELQKACELGYHIIEVYEVWHFEKTTTTLFSDYIDTFLKLKQESSKLPDWCQSPEDVQRFRDEYEQHEGIKLGEIGYNSGRRALAKLMANSMWGFFGKKDDMGKIKYFMDPEPYFTLLADPKVNVKDISVINEHVVRVNYVEERAFRQESKTNVVIAAYTTAHARLKLHSILQPLQDRVLYYDTDSVIYRHRSDQWNPPTGNYLGDLTDELDGDTIKTFVSGGPKNYAYECTKSGKTCCKVKGFTLNHRTSHKINFKSMVDLVTTNRDQRIAVLNPSRIKRGKDMKIHSKNERKEYGIVYNKRVIIPGTYNTVPYGY